MNLYIFDFFGVLSDEIMPKFFTNHIDDERKAKELKSYYLNPCDLGERSLKDAIRIISIDLKIDEIVIMNEIKGYARLNKDVLDFILTLKKNNKTALLSNASKDIFEMLFEIDFNKYFDKTFISAYYGIMKPDIKFYEMCVNSFTKDFDNIYFIDDNIDNVLPLKNTKIQGIRFTGLDDLKEILKK